MLDDGVPQLKAVERELVGLWLKLSVHGGKTFSDLDFTKLLAADTTYGGWAGDQVVHYVPAIDCFVLYVQSYKGTGVNASKNVVKTALASPADLKKFLRRQGQRGRGSGISNSDDFGLGAATPCSRTPPPPRPTRWTSSCTSSSAREPLLPVPGLH